MILKKGRLMGKSNNLIDLQEHRRSDRFHPKMKHDARITRHAEPSLFRGILQCIIRDVSREGVGLYSEKAIRKNELVNIDIFLPSCKLSVSGHVVHCREFQSGFVIGIKFYDSCLAIRSFLMTIEDESL